MRANLDKYSSNESVESLLSSMGVTGHTVALGKGSCQLGAVTAVSDDRGQYEYLVAKNSRNEGVFLLPGSHSELTEDAYEAITEEASAAGLAGIYHVCSHRCLIATDDVVWYRQAAS